MHAQVTRCVCAAVLISVGCVRGLVFCPSFMLVRSLHRVMSCCLMEHIIEDLLQVGAIWVLCRRTTCIGHTSMTTKVGRLRSSVWMKSPTLSLRRFEQFHGQKGSCRCSVEGPALGFDVGRCYKGNQRLNSWKGRTTAWRREAKRGNTKWW